MIGEHAAVIGGSIAGLLAARVLSRHFERVTVLERDAAGGPRRGVPQASQTHVLLPAGAQALDRLFPGRLTELVQAGAHRFDYGGSRFHLIGNWMPRVETGLMTLGQTRLFLESHLSRWVSGIPNVEIVNGFRVSGLLVNPGRVGGVTFEGSPTLEADLVIDASGRGSRLPQWLQIEVPQSVLSIGLGYVTGRFRIPANVSPDHPILYVVGPPPLFRRFGSVCTVESDGTGIIANGALGGYHGEHPPSDLPGFLAFAKSLRQPDIYDILSRSELLDPLTRYAIRTAVRRHYQSVKELPAGILPIGDAACSFDPSFAQGMSVAAQQAEALDDCLNEAKTADHMLTKRYLRKSAALINLPWDLACGENLKYPQTVGRRTLRYRVSRPYRDRLATCGDSIVTREFYRVLTLTASPAVLLHPEIVMRALLPGAMASFKR